MAESVLQLWVNGQLPASHVQRLTRSQSAFLEEYADEIEAESPIAAISQLIDEAAEDWRDEAAGVRAEEGKEVTT